MTRLGWWMLLGFMVAIGLFALVVRRGEGPVPTQAPATPTSQVAAAGPLVIPVAGIAARQLADTWGDARGDGTRAHHAIDIMAPRGTPVVAAAAGTVEKLFESKDGGHTIYVRVDPATIHYYAHLDTYAPDLREGVAVARGQRIATVGSTGDASPEAPHLHFEIKRMAPGEGWWQGVEQNPYPLLRAAA